jgi:SAM-dependent methyltransferase
MAHDHSAPSAFVEAWIEALAVRLKPDAANGATHRKALDVAMGRGRHALLLAGQGFVTFGVDAKREIVRDAVETAARQGLRIRGWCADLTMSPLPVSAFDLVVVARYLQRNLFDSIKAAVKPRGCVIYETFTVAQLAHGAGPKSPDHLLQPGELRSAFAGWDVLFYEEVDADEAVARLVAQRSLSV